MTSASSTDDLWSRLTASSKAALRWAAALARARDPSAVPDALDLLAGIMLAHLRDSPPRQLLEHFGVPAGLLFMRDGAAPPSAEALRAAVATIAQDRLPPVGPEIELAVYSGSSVQPQEQDGLVSLRLLFGGLLSNGNAATAALRSQLTAHGADPDSVFATYPEFLAHRESYAEFLRGRHPRRPPVVPLPALQPDQPRDRRPPPDRASDPPDLVGIRAEVDAFAYLIAAKRLVPPLAIGLFGNWGGGKSYFLRSVQRRVDELISTEAPPGRSPDELPFHRSVVQVEYNAWQYVEGDLWSSLLEHLFRNLAPATGAEDDLLAQRQRTVIEQLRQTGDRHDKAQLERGQLEDKLRVATAEVHQRTQERAVKLAELERRRREAQPRIKVSQEVREAIGSVLARAGFDAVATEAEGLRAELRQAGETWRHAGPVLAPLRNAGWRYLTALVVLLALTPAVAWILDRFDLSTVTAAAGALATLLATLAGYVRIGSSFVGQRLTEISDARARLDRELAEGRQQLDDELAEAQQAVDTVEGQLADAADTERKLTAEAAALEVTLAETTSSRVLGEFLTERLGSSDYRGRLGVPALVRRDLARLSTLIQQRQASGTVTNTDEHGIDRIVLYIDDLDRCPTRLVVDVLQAVHLLLAFPLFVVVVAVDARWLTHSLRDHYRQLTGPDADPEDFIEKIFQIPFWVRPLDAETRRRMITGLITPSLRAADPDTTGATAQTTAPDIAEDDLPEFHALVASFGDTEAAEPPWLQTASLTVTPEELAWIERVAPLLGDTPRAVKRYANIYLLLRSIARGRGWTTPTGGQAIVLLALATGFPELADVMLATIEQAPTTPFSLRDALPPEPDPNQTPDWAPQHAALTQWLDHEPEAATMDVSGMTGWIDLIRRFRFRR